MHKFRDPCLAWFMFRSESWYSETIIVLKKIKPTIHKYWSTAYFFFLCSFVPRITLYHFKSLSFVVWMSLASFLADSRDGLAMKFSILCNFKIAFPFWNVCNSKTSPWVQELWIKVGSLWRVGGLTRLRFCNL